MYLIFKIEPPRNFPIYSTKYLDIFRINNYNKIDTSNKVSIILMYPTYYTKNIYIDYSYFKSLIEEGFIILGSMEELIQKHKAYKALELI